MVSNMKHDDLISYDMIRHEQSILLENMLGSHMISFDKVRYAMVNYTVL